jgi:hypothetical protein
MSWKAPLLWWALLQTAFPRARNGASYLATELSRTRCARARLLLERRATKYREAV